MEDKLQAIEETVYSPANSKPPSALRAVLSELFRLLVKIAAIALIALVLFTFLFGVHRSTENAMHPMVKDGDLIVFYRLDKSYTASDVVVIERDGALQTRRVIAVAGDRVDITENGLMINGAYVQESDIYEETHRYTVGTEFPLTVGENQVFVLGDSREHAQDSRIYGCVDKDDICGTVMLILRRRGI